MATCTPVYGLPYAEGDDPPCDIGETLCAFADAVEAELDRLDAVVERTVDTVPIVQLRLTAPFTFTTTTNTTVTIPFDTIDVDTAEMADLTLSPYQITLPRGGRYLTAFQVEIAAITSGDTVIASFSPGAYDQYISDGSTPVYLNGGGELRYAPTGSGVPVDTTSPIVSFTLSVLSGTFTVNAVTVSMAWIGDLP